MQLLYALAELRTPFLDAVLGALTNCGGELVFMAAAIIVFWCVSKSCGYYMLTVGFVGTIVNQFLKLVFRIPRPWVKDPDFQIVESARAEATGYSFPSGHTQNVFASPSGFSTHGFSVCGFSRSSAASAAGRSGRGCVWSARC